MKNLNVRLTMILLLLIFMTGVAVSLKSPMGNPILPPGPPILSVSTVPANGDVNPYGVAFVPAAFPSGGLAHPGDILVSNFNDSANIQGTGSTIVDINQQGQQSLFFQDPTPVGLTTALGVVSSGFVLVGKVPTTDGTCTTIGPGGLLVIRRNGSLLVNLFSGRFLNSPWDLAVNDQGATAQVFVSNVLSGTVARLDFKVSPGGRSLLLENATQIGSGYSSACNAAAVVVGPTGLAYDPKGDKLFVASTDDNAIFVLHDAGKTQKDQGRGKLVYQDNTHLHGPLGLALAPNGHLLTTNGDAINPDPNQPSEMVEFTRQGQFVAEFSVNSTGEGGAFGLAVGRVGSQFQLAAVDDILNVLDVWNIQ